MAQDQINRLKAQEIDRQKQAAEEHARLLEAIERSKQLEKERQLSEYPSSDIMAAEI